MSLATPAGARSMLQGRGRVAPAPSFASFTGCVGLVGLLLALASTAVAAAPPAAGGAWIQGPGRPGDVLQRTEKVDY